MLLQEYSVDIDAGDSQKSFERLEILRTVASPWSHDQLCALRVAEAQAMQLLELVGATAPPVPLNILAPILPLTLRSRSGLPVSGLTFREDGLWVIGTNGSEPRVRQRFTVAHEVKHILDDPFVQRLGRPAYSLEDVADYFAASLLMPQHWIANRTRSGEVGVAALARMFAVSVPAMATRVSDLVACECA